MPLPVPVSPAQLEDLAKEYGTPYQLYDEAAMRANCKALVNAFGSRFKGFKQFFAVKALPNPAILKLMVEEGCGLDCSSTAELHIARALGVPGRDVMYTSNYTSKKDLAVAFDQGVIINLDDASLVQSLVEVRGRCPDLICFRLNPGLGRTDSETASNVLGGADAKFGVPPDQIVEAYRAAQAAGATRFGLHMMTGSCVLNSEYWRHTVTALLGTLLRLKQELGITCEFINIGGGLGIPYKPDQPVVDVQALAGSLKELMDTWWAAHGAELSSGGANAAALPTLYMENGRYMTGPFGWLVSRCEAVKRANGSVYYGLDACMANLMRPGMYNSYHHITVPAREGANSSRHAANVVGTLCENNDWFAKARDLPVSDVGDLFVIHDTGAHSHSMGFQYNGKLRAPELLLRSAAATASTTGSPRREVHLIRRREEIADLFLNTLLPADLQPAPVALPAPYPYTGQRGAGASGGAAATGSWLARLLPTGSTAGAWPAVAAAAAGLAVVSLAGYHLLCPHSASGKAVSSSLSTAAAHLRLGGGK